MRTHIAFDTHAHDVRNVAVDICPTLGALPNGTLNSSDVVYNTIVEATCDDGYTFTKDNRTTYLRCVEGGVWNATMMSCQGTCSLYNTCLSVLMLQTFDLIVSREDTYEQT